MPVLTAEENVAEAAKGISGSTWKNWKIWQRQGEYHRTPLPGNMSDQLMANYPLKNAYSMENTSAASLTLLIIAAQNTKTGRSNAEHFLFGMSLR